MKTTIFLLGALTFASVASASIITCDFNSPTGDLLSATHDYNCGGFIITATVFGGGNLFGKNDGGDEIGIGVSTGSDHEIEPGHFIQLDLINILGLNPMTLKINSGTGADRYELFNTSLAGTLGGTVLSGPAAGEPNLGISPTLRYLDLTATAGDILQGPLTFTAPVPEPASLGLIAFGLISVGLLRRRVTAARN